MKKYKPLGGECPVCETPLQATKPERYKINESYVRCHNCNAFLHVIATHWRARFNLAVPR